MNTLEFGFTFKFIHAEHGLIHSAPIKRIYDDIEQHQHHILMLCNKNVIFFRCRNHFHSFEWRKLKKCYHRQHHHSNCSTIGYKILYMKMNRRRRKKNVSSVDNVNSEHSSFGVISFRIGNKTLISAPFQILKRKWNECRLIDQPTNRQNDQPSNEQ